MGKRYVPHSDMCGCDRCAKSFECDNPYQVFDEIDDPEIMDCGCSVWRGCDCPYDGEDD